MFGWKPDLAVMPVKHNKQFGFLLWGKHRGWSIDLLMEADGIFNGENKSLHLAEE